jgi:hypothetical protein
MLSSRILFIAYVALAVIIVVWNVAATGRIIANRRAPKLVTGLTAFAALLLAPGLVVAVSASSIVYGRAIQPIGWLWALVTVLFALQAMAALAKRLVNPAIGIPIVAYNAIIAIVAVARFLNTRGIEPPSVALALSAAQSAALGVVGGSAAWSKAMWLLVPLISPARPSRSRLKLAMRTMLTIAVTVTAALVMVRLPVAIETIRSYARYTDAPLQERPAGDFSFGLKIFPELRGAPPALAITNDLSLADSIGVDAISVLVDPEALTARALDSLGHMLDNARSDSTLIIITLGYPRGAREAIARAPGRYVDDRVTNVNRIARTLRPNVIIPAHEPYGDGARIVGIQPPEFWMDYIRRTAAIAHYVNPNIRIGMAAASYGTRDSTLYAWAASRNAPVDIVGFSFMPGYDGAGSLDTHLRIARRWMRMYERPKPHWVWAAGGYPVAHGERSQQLALRGVFSWATSQPYVNGVIVLEAGDYDTQQGLRAPSRRLRPALGELMRALTSIRESAR